MLFRSPTQSAAAGSDKVAAPPIAGNVIIDPDCAAVSTVPEVYPVTIFTVGTTKVVAPVIVDVPVPVMLPLESISKLVVTAPVDAFLEICSKPPSDLTGPL